MAYPRIFHMISLVLMGCILTLSFFDVAEKFSVKTRPIATVLKSITKVKNPYDHYENCQIQLVEWICIPPHSKKIKDQCEPPDRILTIFNSNALYTNYLHGIPVRFLQTSIPAHYKILENYTAIFHGYHFQYDPGNIYHVFLQYYIPFHFLLDFWHRSNFTPNVQIFFPRHLLQESCLDNKNNITSFFLRSLPFVDLSSNQDINYNSHPGNVCFRYGLLSNTFHTDHTLSAISHLKQFHQVEMKSCAPGNIILSKRSKNRIWMNIEATLDAIKDAGYTDAIIVNFSEIPLKEQLQIASCASVFIAPHSAALTWASFMPLDSSVIEIAWPKYGWPFFYSALASFYGKVPLNFYQLEAKNVTNFAFSVKHRMIVEYGMKKQYYETRGNVTNEELIRMFPGSSLGKHCNFDVDPQQLVNIIRKALASK